LGGAKASDITVLPDMNGVSANFNMSDVLGQNIKASNGLQRLPLLVSAPQGSAAPLEIDVLGSQVNDGINTCASPFLASSDGTFIPATIVSASPATICADADHVPVIIDGVNLPSSFTIESTKFVGMQPTATTTDSEGKKVPVAPAFGNRRQIVILDLKKGKKLIKNEEVPIVLIAKDLSVATRVSLTVSDCAGGAGAPKAPAAAVTATGTSASAQLTITTTPPETAPTGTGATATKGSGVVTATPRQSSGSAGTLTGSNPVTGNSPTPETGGSKGTSVGAATSAMTAGSNPIKSKAPVVVAKKSQ
jgi:hypothetical protein